MEKVGGEPGFGACWPLIIPPTPTFFTLLDWEAHVVCVYEPRWPSYSEEKHCVQCLLPASSPSLVVISPSFLVSNLFAKKDISDPPALCRFPVVQPHSAEMWDEPSDILEVNWGALSARTLHLRSCEGARPCGEVPASVEGSGVSFPA